jgi:CRISPR-associated protein Cst2
VGFVTGILLIDAQASALNNQGALPGARTDNVIGVKSMSVGGRTYPYVSAQAFKYWLRATLAANVPEWKAAPVFREGKVAYTDADPIKWWDDDLFGYMRAPSKKANAARSADWAETALAENTTLTRAAPFRVSTLVSLAPNVIATDFGVMARQEDDPVPFEHQFYRTALKGLFSLNLREAGRFSYVQRTGFLHLDENRVHEAEEKGLLHDEPSKCYRLAASERVRRVAALFQGLSMLEGGAKQSMHYTDVAPPFVAFAVTTGGNHIFNYLVDGTQQGDPIIEPGRLREILETWKDTILAGPYIGWAPGYQETQRKAFAAAVEQPPVEHPRRAFARFINELQENGAAWFEQ